MCTRIDTKDMMFFFFQAEDGIRDVERSRGLGDVYKRQDYSGISVYCRDRKSCCLKHTIQRLEQP